MLEAFSLILGFAHCKFCTQTLDIEATNSLPFFYLCCSGAYYIYMWLFLKTEVFRSFVCLLVNIVTTPDLSLTESQSCVSHSVFNVISS